MKLIVYLAGILPGGSRSVSEKIPIDLLFTEDNGYPPIRGKVR